MKSTQTLTGTFTSSQEKAYVHGFELVGSNTALASRLFHDHVADQINAQFRKYGAPRQADVEALYTASRVLLDRTLDIQSSNMVTTVDINPALVEKLGLAEGDRVEIQVRPHTYRPAAGLSAVAARSEKHPAWVTLNI